MNVEKGEAKIQISDELTGVRIDAGLAQLYPEFTRNAWQKHIKSGGVLLSGKPLKPSYTLKGGEQLEFSGTPARIEIQQIATTDELPIIYEDDDVIVINKPSGLITHPKPGSHQPSVSGSLMSHVVDSDSIRPGIVHRLDKDTSGVMIIAKHAAAKSSLQAAFKARSVTKEYYALVYGELGIGVRRIHFALARSTQHATQMEVDPLGKPSETYVQQLSAGDDVSLILARPTTGRTHQIRVHLAAIQHPIVGDKMYGPSETGRNRLMLHAYSLKIPLPSGVVHTFTVPPGEDFLAVLAQYHCNYPVQ